MPDDDIQIDKGIPIPPRYSEGNSTRGRGGRYPWIKMKVGDSFLFPPEINYSAFAQASNRSKGGKKFIVRRVKDGRYRCWRTE